MNTFQDLNNLGNTSVTYASEANTAISWGSLAGTANLTVDEDSSHVLQKQIDLLSATELVRDIVVTINVPAINNYNTVGNITIGNTVSKFGNSYFFDDNNSFISVNKPVDLSGEFTFEGWLYPQNLSVSYIFDSSDEGVNDVILRFQADQSLVYRTNNTDKITTAGVIVANNWQHVAVTRDSANVVTIWHNGGNVGSVVDTTDITSNDNITVGIRNTSDFADLLGYMDDIRISANCRYTGNFSVATSALESDANTVILLQAEDLNDQFIRPVSGITYNGTYGNILINRQSDSFYRVRGIRDLNRYDEVFANTYVQLNTDMANNFTYTTTVDDQLGNTYTWDTNITINEGDITFNSTDIAGWFEGGFVGNVNGNTGIEITDPIEDREYELTIDARITTGGNIGGHLTFYIDGADSGNSITLTGNRTEINNQIASNVTMKTVPRFNSLAGPTYYDPRDIQNTTFAFDYTLLDTPANVLASGTHTVNKVVSDYIGIYVPDEEAWMIDFALTGTDPTPAGETMLIKFATQGNLDYSMTRDEAFLAVANTPGYAMMPSDSAISASNHIATQSGKTTYSRASNAALPTINTFNTDYEYGNTEGGVVLNEVYSLNDVFSTFEHFLDNLSGTNMWATPTESASTNRNRYAQYHNTIFRHPVTYNACTDQTLANVTVYPTTINPSVTPPGNLTTKDGWEEWNNMRNTGSNWHEIGDLTGYTCSASPLASGIEYYTLVAKQTDIGNIV